MIWQFIHEQISKGSKVYLIIVTETIGSSPGKVGFKMAVSSSGELKGSIGGGIMEYKLVEMARKLLKTEETPKSFAKRQVHNHDAEEDKSGMICSGEQTQIFVPFSSENITDLNNIINAVQQSKKGIITFTNNSIKLLDYNNKSAENLPAFNMESADSWNYSESINISETVYIFGAGHISVPLSQILSMLDFRVEVFDNRKELVTFDQNSFAHKKEIIDYNEAEKYVTEGSSSYVAIMTFGHKFDETVLKQFLNKKLKYLGMIGSKSKVKEIFEELVKQGYTREQVERVCSPIGLPIGGQTPAEIALSIAAQMIQYRYK
ncbi:MAG: XdhC family protein [Bacteroidales bacterium]|nr:XdhC family protein [Bacteroidales bacterium]